MSRLTELLDELCPDGVDYRPLGQVITRLRTGLNPRKNFVLNPEGATNYYITVRELGGFKIQITEKTDCVDDAGLQSIQNRSGLLKGDVLFSGTGTIGRTALVSTEPANWNIKEGVYALTPNYDFVDSRFLVYVINSRAFQDVVLARSAGGTVKSISMKNLVELTLPVPPLEVQQEIVRVLDAFTNLEQSLVSELELRKKQFVTQRDRLLGAGVEPSTLGEKFRMKAGKFVKASEIAQDSSEDQPYPCYGANGLRGYVSHTTHEGDFVAVGRQGALSGNTLRVSGCFAATEHAIVVSPLEPDDFDIDWIYHKLTAMNLNQYVTKGAQPGLSVRTLQRVPFRYDELVSQKSIARKLDAFESLIQSIEQEIVLRRKQYEFYRDQLLSFTPKEA